MDELRIHLEEQDHSFAADKAQSAGGVLRIYDNRITLNAENLKRDIHGYKLILIGRKNGNSVYKMIGDIVPDEGGHVDFKCIINPENIDGEGTELSCFYIFMVAAMSTPIRPVLKGDRVEAVRKQKTYNGYYREYMIYKTAQLESGKAVFADISPFDDAWLADSWKRVNDVTLLPVASVGAEQQMKKYGHFIFGTRDNCFYLGIPGRHTEDEWPDRGASGFMLWQPIKVSGEYGYWCMVIDCKTGIITEIS